ncbi:MAG: hypothetical protein ABI823_19535 [Bryobacteraceae bacterium]
MVELLSRNFAGDDRLRKCANDNAFNIRPNTSGDHVRKVQSALLGLNRPPGVKISDEERKNQFYGPDTAQAVRNFKNSFSPKILGPGQVVVDPIVGIQTIRRLDLLLQQQAKNDDIVVTKTTDVLLEVIGHDQPARTGKPVPRDFTEQIGIGVRSANSFDKDIETDEYKRLHNPFQHLMFFGGGKAEVMAQAVKDKFDPKGVLIIVGMSIGGPTALEVARMLKDMKISYMALCDAAFPNGADNRRQISSDASIRENFFQRQGDSIDQRQEFHGPVSNFMQFDFTNDAEFAGARAALDVAIKASNNPNPLRQEFIFDIHNLAAAKGYRRAQVQIRSLLV